MSDTAFPDCAPIFVVGSPRSGTTLLQMMLNAHPALAVAGELHYFDQILQIRRSVPELTGPEHIDRLFALLPTVYHARFFADLEAVFPQVRRRLEADPRPTYEKLYRFLLEGNARAHGARRGGEKTPTNVRYLDRLVAIFPNCRVIHIVRDPRANVASRLKVPWTSDDVVTNALKWKIDVLCARAFVERHGRGRELCKEVLYERLVAAPEAELREICRFLGEEFDERMLRYHESARRFVRDEPWKEGTLRPAHASSIEAWRRELSGAQIFLVERITAPLMRRYGYAEAGVGPAARILSPLAFLREAARYARWKVGEQRSRRREGAVIYGDNSRLYGMLVRAVLRGRR